MFKKIIDWFKAPPGSPYKYPLKSDNPLETNVEESQTTNLPALRREKAVAMNISGSNSHEWFSIPDLTNVQRINDINLETYNTKLTDGIIATIKSTLLELSADEVQMFFQVMRFRNSNEFRANSFTYPRDYEHRWLSKQSYADDCGYKAESFLNQLWSAITFDPNSTTIDDLIDSFTVTKSLHLRDLYETSAYSHYHTLTYDQVLDGVTERVFMFTKNDSGNPVLCHEYVMQLRELNSILIRGYGDYSTKSYLKDARYNSHETSRRVRTYVTPEYIDQTVNGLLNKYKELIQYWISYWSKPWSVIGGMSDQLRMLVNSKIVIEDLKYFNYDPLLELEITRELSGKPSFSITLKDVPITIHSNAALNTNHIPKFFWHQYLGRLQLLIATYGK